MNEKRYFSNTALAVIVCVALAVCRILRTCIPFGVLPELDIPNMVLLSGLALLADHYFGAGENKTDLWVLLLATVTFGVLPVAAGFVQLAEGWKPALVGGAVFWITAWLYGSIQDRLSTGPAAKAAPALSVLGLYLAAQCFSGMII